MLQIYLMDDLYQKLMLLNLLWLSQMQIYYKLIIEKMIIHSYIIQKQCNLKESLKCKILLKIYIQPIR